MNIAIVGAGISGLVAARLLQQQHAITVFEAGAYPGGDTSTSRQTCHSRSRTSAATSNTRAAQ